MASSIGMAGRLTATHRRAVSKKRRRKTEMNPVAEVKTNPNPAPEFAIVKGGAAAAL
jgi:hypothetical protein